MSELLQRAITNAFHVMYYDSQVWNASRTRWLNVPVFQNPMDMWMLQQVIVDTKPTLIVETGSALGGSALFYLACFNGKVISIDVQTEIQPVIVHPRIEFIKSRSVDENTLALVRERAMGERVMVVLDSDHSYENVLAELHAYAPLVSEDCYCVVCDTNLQGHPVWAGTPDDPMGAVAEFLRTHDEFEIDSQREAFFMTWNPNGWLRRKPA